MRLLAQLVFLLACHCNLGRHIPPARQAVPVEVVVQDSSGATLENELVIVQNLDNHEKEMVRALTDARGEVPAIQLSPGMYRAIATAPYGIWQTTVQEFLVGDMAVKLFIKVMPLPTHGFGDIVTIGTGKMSLKIVDFKGKPIAGASVLARDREATQDLERWYKTDATGRATIEIVAEPLIVVVVREKTLIVREFSLKSGAETIQLPEQ